MDTESNPDPGSSRNRSTLFRYPVIFPEGLLYYKSHEAADNARRDLVLSRLRSSGEIGGSRTMRLKKRSMKGRMG